MGAEQRAETESGNREREQRAVAESRSFSHQKFLHTIRHDDGLVKNENNRNNHHHESRLHTGNPQKGCKSQASTIQPRCSTGTRSARTSTSALSSSGSTCCASSTICIGASQRSVARGKPQSARGEAWLLAVVLGIKRVHLLRIGRLAATPVHPSAALYCAPWHLQPHTAGA